MTFGNFALDFGVRGRRGNGGGGGGASSVTFVGAAQASWARGAGYTFDLTSLTGGTDTSPSDGDCIVLLCNSAPNLLGEGYIPLPAEMEIVAQIWQNNYDKARTQAAYMFASSTTELVIASSGLGPVAGTVMVFRGVDRDSPLLGNTPTTGAAIDPADPPAISHTPGTPGVSIYMAAVSCGAGVLSELILDPGNLDYFLAEPSTLSDPTVIGAGFKIGQTGELTVDFEATTEYAVDWVATAMGFTLAADRSGQNILTEDGTTRVTEDSIERLTE